MDNNYKDLTPIRHKEFNEFIKGKGFKGRNNYKLRDSILYEKLQLLQEYHTVPFYMLRRVPGIEFALMEKNIQ